MHEEGPIPSDLIAAEAAAAAPGGATVPLTVISLAKNIVGSGVLALAAGVGTFSASRVAILPAILLLSAMCSLSAYTFSLIARVSAAVGASSYKEAWAKIFGERSSLIPSVIIIFKTFVGALAYAIILGDSSASMATLAGAPALLQKSNTWIVLISSLVLLPLCLLRDLSSLAIGSIIGTAGTLYTALFMSLRFFDKSYVAGGAFHSTMATALQPKFAAATGSLLNAKAFVLVSMMATTFLAHYNAPKFYTELAPSEDGSSKLPRFNLAVAGGFGLAAILCSSIMSAGFLTFGAASQCLILNNYATADPLAFIARLGITTSVLFSYPLLFLGFRDGVLSLLKLSKYAHRPDVHRLTTVLLIAVVNGLALVLKDLGLITALGGAVLGSTLVYIMPALMAIAVGSRQAKAGGASDSAAALSKPEALANYGLAGLGAFLAIVGAVTTLQSSGGGGH